MVNSYTKKGFYILCSLLVGCTAPDTPTTDKAPENTLFSLLPAAHTGVDFVNEVENQKDFNIFKYRNFYNGGGVAIGDVNNDSLPDIYFTANMKPNRLYINKGDFTFEDVTEKAGVQGDKPWSTGVAMVDINSDGHLDIYVSNAGNLEGNNHDNELFINNGDGTFSEQAHEYNLAKTGFSTHAAFFDYDKDGDLDAYILNNSNIPVSSLGYADHRQLRAKDWDVPSIFKGVGDLLMRNDGGRFVDVSEEAGIYGSLIGFGLGVHVSDLNNDSYPDIYVSNDFYERDYLYINNQDGTFTEDIKNWTSHLCLSAMGVDMADINNDGLNDIFITDMLPEKDQRIKSVMEFEGYNVFKLKQKKDFYQQYIQNTLQVNNGNQSFSEVAYFSGVAKTDWSWAGLIFDMDNDGFKDIYVTNGINHDLTDIDFVDFFANEVIQKLALTGKKEDILSIIDKMPVVPIPNYAYHNQGDLSFKDATQDWGLKIPSFSNGCAYADFDNDGDLDVVVNNVNMEAFLFRNNASEYKDNRYLKVRLEGNEKNPFAIGTTARVYANAGQFYQELMPFRGFQSSMDYELVFGLGQISQIDSLVITWFDDKQTVVINPETNIQLNIRYDEAKKRTKPLGSGRKKTLLRELPNDKMVEHEENFFNDFDYEGLIASQLSQEGPTLSVGDLNGDGHEDAFVGGAKGKPGVIYFHNGKGELSPTSQPALEQDAYLENTASVFFDADGDGDLDLAVGNGGNEPAEILQYGVRLYLNDGKGKFSKAATEMPPMDHNVSVIAACDYDQDGDQDLFVGARSVPGIYGIDPRHALWINDGTAIFTDATEKYAYPTKSAGMVTDAIWVDADQDGRKDLITVADWGTPVVFRNTGKRLERMASMLDSLHGWWNTIEAADLDKDGDLDFVIGNRGSNTMYKATPQQPVKIWVNDFDNNGGIEQITTTHYNNGDYPIHMRKELTSQIVSLKKENLKASDYASKTIHELFGEATLQSTIMKQANTDESIVVVNQGGGQFDTVVLPNRVQLSCVCGITCTDVNADGNLDIVLAGNNFEFKPQYSRLDASYGSILLGDGRMGFEWQDYATSGFFIRDEVKHLRTFHDQQGTPYLFAAINDQKPKVYAFNK